MNATLPSRDVGAATSDALLVVDGLQKYFPVRRGVLQRQVEGALAIFGFKSLALAREAHQSIEHIAANLPDFTAFQSSDSGCARRST